LRDLHGLSFRISAITPELESTATTLNSLVLQRWQLNKLVTQSTNRLHQASARSIGLASKHLGAIIGAKTKRRIKSGQFIS
jgi:hypothetical protein